MKRKILSMILVLVLVLSLVPITAMAAFTDVQNHWAQEAIDHWSDLGVINGSGGNFRPDDPITRGEMAVIIDRLMKYQTAAPNTFSDLGQDFYTDSILKANAAGIINGYSGIVRPTAEITREEAVVMLGRAFGLTESTAASGFDDITSFSSWASGYISTMAAKGYIHGSKGLFNAQSPIKRAEIVTILDNAVAGLYSEAKEYSGSIRGIAIVNTPGVVLKDMTITGDLIIAEGVGSGNVTLTNVKVTGNTIVRGGGPNSVVINGSSALNSVIVEKADDGRIRIVVSEGATVKELFIQEGEEIVLTGTFKKITLSTETIVRVAANSVIDELSIEDSAARSKIINEGTIKHAYVNNSLVDGKGNDDVIFEGVQPLKKSSPGVAGDNDKPTGGGGAGGGIVEVPATGVVVDKTELVLVIGEAAGTITATVSPSNATNKTVTWTSSDQTVATVANNGVVTPVGAGTAVIKATTSNGKTATVTVTVGDALVDDAAELAAAISVADEGDVIFVSGTIGSIDSYTAYEITEPITIRGLSSASKIYGSFIIKADGVTVDGLTMYVRGGGNGPLKNAIDVIAKKVTITNNKFMLPNPEELGANGGVGNGVTIWPDGTADPDYRISSNIFTGFSADTPDWSSSALQIAEGLELSRFNMSGVTSQAVTLNGAAEAAMAAGNTYVSCSNNYVHSNWSSGIVYYFAYASTIDQFTSSIEYAGDNSTIMLAAGTYELTSTVALSGNLVNLIGAGTGKTFIQYKSAEPQGNGLFAVPVNSGLNGKITFYKISFKNASDVLKSNYVFLSFPGTNANEASFNECSFDNFNTIAYFNNTHAEQDNNNKITVTNCVINNTAWVYSQDDITPGSRPMQLKNIDISGNTGNSAGNGPEVFGGITLRDSMQQAKSRHDSIQAAIDAAAEGDIIEVSRGTYTENVKVDTNNITIIGAGADVTTIVATDGNSTPLAFAANGASVSGFTITHAYTDAELSAWNFNNNGVIFYQNKTGNTLSNCTITLNRNGIYLNNCTDNIIKDNTITNNRTGINMTNTVDNTEITGNTISENWTLGIVYYSQGFATNFNTVTISSNTFDDNWYSEILIKDAGSSSGTLDLSKNDTLKNTFSDVTVTYTTSTDARLNEPSFAAQIPECFGGTASKPDSDLPTLRLFNSGGVTLRYNGKVLNVGGSAVGNYATIQEAVNASGDDDIIKLAAGEYKITETINVTKAVTILGAPGFASIFTTTGTTTLFNLSAGATIDGIYINKTDKTGEQHFITIKANNTTVRNCRFVGQYAQGDNEVVRAIVPTTGFTGYVISGNHFESVRQPAYLEGAGIVTGNFVKNTRGWVVCVNHAITFTDNTFEGNAVDIAIIANSQITSGNYTDIAAISTANNGAYVENQLLKISAKNGHLFVVPSGNQNALIQNAVAGAADGNIIDVAEGTYSLIAQLNVTKPLTLAGQGTVFITVDPTTTWSTVNGSKHLITVYAGTADNPVAFENITFDAAHKAYGVNTYDNAYLELNDVTIQNSKGAGLTVNGSTVVANNLVTSGNDWGAVNVDPGSGVITPSVFTLGSGTLGENKQIWSDGSYVENASPLVTVNVPGDYVMSIISGDYIIWNNKPIAG